MEDILTLSNQDSSGEVVDSFAYTYSDEYLNGWNQTAKTEKIDGSSVGTTAYEYDAQGRLTKVENQRTGINTYTYDAAGNRLSKIGTYLDDKVVDEYTYDEQNRLLQVKSYLDGSADASYTYYDYDNNGNQISRWTQSIHADGGEEYYRITELGVKSTDGTALYGYDNYNRLVSVHQDSTTIENVYNGFGDNVSRTTDGVTTNYVYDGNTVILELNGSGEQTARNVYGRNLILRSGEDDREIYYMYNGHGDVVRTTYAGYTMAKYRYDEFGNVTYEEDCYVVESGIIISPHLQLDPVEPPEEIVIIPPITECYVENPYRYAGYEYLENVDLYDLNARYYDPNTARFLSEDPYYDLGNRVMGLYEINVPNVFSIIQANALYAYCGNSPIRFMDIFGLKPEKLRAMALGLDATIDWDSETRTATVTIEGDIHKYKDGENGVYIDENGKMYVEGAMFAKDFHGTYKEVSGEGYSGYELTIDVEAVKDNPRGADKISAGYQHYVYKKSITYDNTLEGELAAAKADYEYQITAANVGTYYSIIIAGVLTGAGYAIPGTISSVSSIAQTEVDYSLGLHAGDTVQSFYRAAYNYRGGSGGWDSSIIIKGGSNF